MVVNRPQVKTLGCVGAPQSPAAATPAAPEVPETQWARKGVGMAGGMRSAQPLGKAGQALVHSGKADGSTAVLGPSWG